MTALLLAGVRKPNTNDAASDAACVRAAAAAAAAAAAVATAAAAPEVGKTAAPKQRVAVAAHAAWWQPRNKELRCDLVQDKPEPSLLRHSAL